MPGYEYMKEEGGKPVFAWLGRLTLEQEALDQILETSMMPFIHGHMAIMPDAHWGNGCPIGTVLPTDKAIVPAAVGVDLGCGMTAVRIDCSVEEISGKLLDIRLAIERLVPHGRSNNGQQGDMGAWKTVPLDVEDEWLLSLSNGFSEILDLNRGINRNKLDHRVIHQLATLGTGNHFIEVSRAQDDSVWIMLHSGSRGVGNSIASYFIRKAQELNKKWYIDLPNPSLAYLIEGERYFDEYIEAVNWAQRYAKMNRELMLNHVVTALQGVLGRLIGETSERIDCHHNYVQLEHHFKKNVFVTRKGAVSAKQDEMGIIPSSMGRPSFIVRGKGNQDSFHSCSHGAGRKMSRTAARKMFGEEDIKEQTKGLECRKTGIEDELPGCYKDPTEVMAAQEELVDIEHTLTALVCVKG